MSHESSFPTALSRSPELIPYPAGLLRWALRLPLLLQRVGLGSLLAALRLMILTTRGRKSGQARHTPIEFRQHGTKIYVISGWGERPNWLQNLRADPTVVLTIGTRSAAYRASEVETQGEALRVLHLFRRVNPVIYDALIARMTDSPNLTVRTLPDVSQRLTLVRFDRLDTPPPADLRLPRPDLAWLPPVIVGGVLALALMRFARSRRTPAR